MLLTIISNHGVGTKNDSTIVEIGGKENMVVTFIFVSFFLFIVEYFYQKWNV